MEKLNKKGFTLVELLAVIIILAIVVGFTIPAVMTTTNNAKTKTFQSAAVSAADWVDRQYQVVSTGLNGTGIATADTAFTTKCGTEGKSCIVTNSDTTWVQITETAFMAAAGLPIENIDKMYIAINEKTGRSCVYLEAKGDYKVSDTSKNKTTAGACGFTAKIS